MKARAISTVGNSWRERSDNRSRIFAAVTSRMRLPSACSPPAPSITTKSRRSPAEGVRFVDVMERAEIKHALDNQMQPVREGSHELEAAHEQAAALREELTERTRDVRKLAELLAQE